MERATVTENPWLSMWTRPRATVRQLVQTDSTRMVLVLAALTGVVQMLSRASFESLGDLVSPGRILLVAVVLGPVLGIVSLYLSSLLLGWSGRWIGGAASREMIRTAVAWAAVPVVTSLFLWIPAIVVFGDELFTSLTPRINESLLLSGLLMAWGLISVVLAVWSIVLLLKALGEVQGFSAWKALANLLLAGLILLGPVVLIGIAAALLWTMSG